MNEKLIKLYVEKFIKGEIDFEGIKLKISLSHPDDRWNYLMTLELENPLNKPYTMSAIEGAYIRSFNDFVKILGDRPGKHKPLSYCYFLNVEDIHIPKEFDDKIKSAGQTIKTYNIKGRNIGNFTMDLKFIRYEIDVNDNAIDCDVKFIVERLFDNEIKREIDTVYLSKIFGKIFDKVYEFSNIPDLNYDLCSPISSVIYNESTFIDQNDGFMRFNCDFYTKAGTRI